MNLEKKAPDVVGTAGGAKETDETDLVRGQKLEAICPVVNSPSGVSAGSLFHDAGRAGTGTPGHAQRGLACPPGLPCLNSNNSITRPAGLLSSGHRRTAFALEQNVLHLAKVFGLESLGILTLTFADHVTDLREAQRRFNSVASNVLKARYRAAITVVERMKSGRIHFHLVVALGKDIRSGVDFGAISAGDYRSAGSALRSEWSFWRQTAKRYGFGRTELLPVKSTAEAIGVYVGKYIAKHMDKRVDADKGARLVRYTKNARMCGTRFAWVGVRPWLWRKKLATWCGERGIQDTDVLKNHLGPRWAWKLKDQIAGQSLATVPTACHAFEMGWFGEGSLVRRGERRRFDISPYSLARLWGVPLPEVVSEASIQRWNSDLRLVRLADCFAAIAAVSQCETKKAAESAVAV